MNPGLQRLAGADIAIGRGREAGPGAEGDDHPGFGGGRGGRDAGREGLPIRNVVVGRHGQGDGLGMGLGNHQSRGDQGRPGIAPFRLGDNHALHTHGRKLVTHIGHMSRAGDDQRRASSGQAHHPLNGGLEQRTLAEQGDERLGPRRGGDRPKPGARPAAENDRMDSQGRKSLSCKGKRASKPSIPPPTILSTGGTVGPFAPFVSCFCEREKAVTGLSSASGVGGPRTGVRGRVCLAGSGGGHVRQLVDLEPAVEGHDHFFITEDSGFTRDLASRSRVRFVTHFALGQGRLGSPLRMIASGIRNFFQSAAIVLAERPRWVITTGAGSVYFTVLWARLIGARVILIEILRKASRASRGSPDLAGPLARYKVVQSAALAGALARCVGLRSDAGAGRRAAAEKTAAVRHGRRHPRLRPARPAVARLEGAGAIPEEIIVQTGGGGVRPPGLDTHETLPFKQMRAILRDADIVVCHGGTGSLITALREGCWVVAMPRRFEDGDHYDDHQSEITHAFAERGLIEVARSEEELAAALQAVRARPPVVATSEPTELIAYLSQVLAGR